MFQRNFTLRALAANFISHLNRIGVHETVTQRYQQTADEYVQHPFDKDRLGKLDESVNALLFRRNHESRYLTNANYEDGVRLTHLVSIPTREYLASLPKINEVTSRNKHIDINDVPENVYALAYFQALEAVREHLLQPDFVTWFDMEYSSFAGIQRTLQPPLPPQYLED